MRCDVTSARSNCLVPRPPLSFLAKPVWNTSENEDQPSFDGTLHPARETPNGPKMFEYPPELAGWTTSNVEGNNPITGWRADLRTLIAFVVDVYLCTCARSVYVPILACADSYTCLTGGLLIPSPLFTHLCSVFPPRKTSASGPSLHHSASRSSTFPSGSSRYLGPNYRFSRFFHLTSSPHPGYLDSPRQGMGKRS